MDFSSLRDRRVMLAAGVGALAIVAALGIGIGALVRGGGHQAETPASELVESAAPASLQVEMGSSESALDLSRPLRCFVGGQFVGMLTLKDCADRNGVPPGQLDVGLDTSGEVAAASSSAALEPLPSAPTPPAALPPATAAPSAPATAPEAAAPSAAAGECWRYSGDWRKVGDDLSLDACVQALYAGKCERPGAADYGRWDDTTLRLVTGKVERQGSGGSFHTLVRQPPGDCSIPHVED